MLAGGPGGAVDAGGLRAGELAAVDVFDWPVVLAGRGGNGGGVCPWSCWLYRTPHLDVSTPSFPGRGGSGALVLTVGWIGP